ncbi:MAG TPA: Crp/Fnr family transcriptional regulator [Rectinemataceae bacterium]|nr:Crp/Fnr family transcriptional regulator [Rectinemataceae bacterium]
MKSTVLVDFPSSVNPEVNELIVRNARSIILPAKKVFVQPGDLVDSIYYIHAGRTRHYMINSDGIEKISYILNNGWFLREGVFVKPNEKVIAERYSITEIPTVLYSISNNCYNKLLHYPEFSNELLRSSTRKNDLLRRELESIVFDTAKDRLLKLLASSAKLKEIIDMYWHRLRISYSHQDIAAILGVNRVTVSRIISTSIKNGELRTVNATIQIHTDVIARMLLDEKG